MALTSVPIETTEYFSLAMTLYRARDYTRPVHCCEACGGGQAIAVWDGMHEITREWMRQLIDKHGSVARVFEISGRTVTFDEVAAHVQAAV